MEQRSLPNRPAAGGDAPITIALYPAVPRMPELLFLHFDCLSEPGPQPGIEVFGFDNLFLQSYIHQGLISPWERGEIEQDAFYAFAWQACLSHEYLYAVPYLVCQEVLIYRKADRELAEAPDLSILASLLGPCEKPDVPWPDPGKGLLCALADPKGVALLYLKALNALDETLPALATLPSDPDLLHPQALASLSQVVQMAGWAQARLPSPDMGRMSRFSEGIGRVVLGSTDQASFLPPEQINQFGVRPCPSGDSTFKIQPRVASLAISADVRDPGRRSVLKELVTLMTGADVIRECLEALPEDGAAGPQYLIPARPDVLRQLAERYALYQQIQAVLPAQAQALLLDQSGYTWLSGNIPAAIRDRLVGPPVLEEKRDLPTWSKNPSFPANLLERWG